MISKDFYLFKRVWIGALGVWNTGMDCLRGMDRDLRFWWSSSDTSDFSVGKAMSLKTIPQKNQHFDRWYVHHSQSWVVYYYYCCFNHITINHHQSPLSITINHHYYPHYHFLKPSQPQGVARSTTSKSFTVTVKNFALEVWWLVISFWQ